MFILLWKFRFPGSSLVGFVRKLDLHFDFLPLASVSLLELHIPSPAEGEQTRLMRTSDCKIFSQFRINPMKASAWSTLSGNSPPVQSALKDECPKSILLLPCLDSSFCVCTFDTMLFSCFSKETK